MSISSMNYGSKKQNRSVADVCLMANTGSRSPGQPFPDQTVGCTREKEGKRIFGAIAGDIIGSVYEFLPIKSIDFPLFHTQARLLGRL